MIKAEVIIGDARLLLGDCSEILPMIYKADVVITDPPYGTGTNKWQAKIMLNYKSISAGYFKTPELAHAAYIELKRKYHQFQPEFNR